MHFYCLGPELGQLVAPGRLEVARLTTALLLPAPRLGILQGPGTGEALMGWFPPIRSLLKHFPALTPWGKAPPPYSSIWSLLQPGRMLPRIRITARNGGVYYFFQARCQVFPMN